MFQSAPPRRERSGVSQLVSHVLKVSIRAPAKGAIQFTLPKQWHRTGFNPRPREGSDGTDGHRLLRITRFQSAPPRRERSLPNLFRFRHSRCFNPRPREGSDFHGIRHQFGIQRFQSAPPRRERYCLKCIKSLTTLGFNPRPREGSDSGITRTSICSLGFQSAPPRRER